MTETQPGTGGVWARVRAFLVRHRRALIIATVVYLLAILALILLSQGPQNEPFLYQISGRGLPARV